MCLFVDRSVSTLAPEHRWQEGLELAGVSCIQFYVCSVWLLAPAVPSSGAGRARKPDHHGAHGTASSRQVQSVKHTCLQRKVHDTANFSPVYKLPQHGNCVSILTCLANIRYVRRRVFSLAWHKNGRNQRKRDMEIQSFSEVSSACMEDLTPTQMLDLVVRLPRA